MPATPEVVGAYLAAAGEGYAMPTLRRRVAAIARACGIAGLPLDTKHPAIRETLNHWPHKRSDLALLGVEPADADYGTTLSPEVRKALPSLLQAAKDIIDRWLDGRQSAPSQAGRPANGKKARTHTLPAARLDLLHAGA